MYNRGAELRKSMWPLWWGGELRREGMAYRWSLGSFLQLSRNYLCLRHWPGEGLTFTDLPLDKGSPQHTSDVLLWCIMSYFKPTMWGQIIVDKCRMWAVLWGSLNRRGRKQTWGFLWAAWYRLLLPLKRQLHEAIKHPSLSHGSLPVSPSVILSNK